MLLAFHCMLLAGALTDLRTYQKSSKHEEAMQNQLQLRMDMAVFLQDTVRAGLLCVVCVSFTSLRFVLRGRGSFLYTRYVFVHTMYVCALMLRCVLAKQVKEMAKDIRLHHADGSEKSANDLLKLLEDVRSCFRMLLRRHVAPLTLHEPAATVLVVSAVAVNCPSDTICSTSLPMLCL